MASDGDSLYKAVVFRLDDDTPRLAYAEWLEENGLTDQARFIRIQLMQARGEYRDEYGNPLASTPAVAARFEAEANELLALHRKEWEAPIRKALGARYLEITFHRGFPRDVRVNGVRELIDSRILESDYNTLTGLAARELGNQLPELLSHQGVGSLTMLDLGDNHIGTAGATAIANSPHLANLTALNLWDGYIGNEGAIAIVASPHLTKLTTLNLRHNGIGNAGARAIATSPNFANLTTIDLGANGIGDEGARAIARSPHLATLTELDLGGNAIAGFGHGIGTAGAIAIARSPHLANLTELDLGYN